MLLFKRILTALILLPFLAVFVSVICGAMLGGIAGAQVSARHRSEPSDLRSAYNDNFQEGLKAGIAIRKKHNGAIWLISIGSGAIGATALAFTGILPWCRRKPTPPPLPAGGTQNGSEPL